MPYRIHRAGSTQDAVAVAQGAVGTTANPVVNVEVDSGELVITFNDGTTETFTLPSAGTFGVDQTARSLAEKPLAGFCATRSRRIQDLYGMVVHVIRCNIHYAIDNRR